MCCAHRYKFVHDGWTDSLSLSVVQALWRTVAKKKRVRLPQRALSFSPRVSYLGLCTVIIHECKMSSVCCSLKSWLSRATVSRQRRNSIYRSCFSISLSLSRSSFSLVRCYLFVSGTTRRGQVKLSLEKIYKYNYSDDIKRERL